MFVHTVRYTTSVLFPHIDNKSVHGHIKNFFFLHHFLYYISHRHSTSSGFQFYYFVVLNASVHHEDNNHDLSCFLDYIHYWYMYLYLFLRMVEDQFDIIHDFLLEAHYFLKQLKEMLSTQKIYCINASDIVIANNI